jgi:hypothetical protein
LSTNWLRTAIDETSSAVSDGGDPILAISFEGLVERVYCPNSSEYNVDSDVVEKARDLGATVIAYSNTWSGATVEARIYGKRNGISVMRYAEFFAYLRRKGVSFAD